ncbi:hypothetical protein NBRC116493_25770 [Aurantivibrio infirmus]
MELSSWAAYAIVEACVVLLVICIILVFILRKQKKTLSLAVLQLKQFQIINEKLTKKLVDSQRVAVSANYQEQINHQIQLTKDYHQSLDPGHNIALDLDPESPMPLQVAAFRHAVLVAEKEALNASVDGIPDWRFLSNKLSQLINFYTDFQKTN